MKLSEIYLKAAEKLFAREHRYACNAIEFICMDTTHYLEASTRFKDYFQQKTTSWWAHDDDHDAFEADRLPRQLALLFMHEIAKDLEKKR